jgi:hypothetical protein
LSRIADGGFEAPSAANACAGSIATADARSRGDRSSRSAAVTPGKSQYIMPIPDMNHRRKRRHNATPSQRCTTIAVRLRSICVGHAMIDDVTKVRLIAASLVAALLASPVILDACLFKCHTPASTEADEDSGAPSCHHAQKRATRDSSRRPRHVATITRQRRSR